jgi:hypothetical protein
MRADSAKTLYLAELRGRYTRNTPLVVHCSVLAAVLFDEPGLGSAALAMSGKDLYLTNLLDHEMVSVALKKVEFGLAASKLLGHTGAVSDAVLLEARRGRAQASAQ